MVVLPFSGTGIKANSGLRLEVSSYWVEGSGYRPVKFEVTCLPTAVADRTLDVAFVTKSNRGFSQQTKFEIEIPEGARKVSKVVSVPQNGVWYQWEFEVYEDGSRLRDLCGETGVPRRARSWSWTEAYPVILLIDRDAPEPQMRAGLIGRMQGADGQKRRLPNVRRFVHWLPPENNVYQQNMRTTVEESVPSDDNVLSMIESLTTVELMPPVSLSSQWIDYTSVDLIMITVSDLDMVAKERQDAWLAIRKYVSAGGNLVVHGIGDEFERIKELESLMAFSPTAEDSRELPGWEKPSESSYGSNALELLDSDHFVESYRSNGAVVRERILSSAEELRSATQRNKAPPKPMFRIRPYDLGRVVAFNVDQSFGDAAQWNWLLAELGRDRWQWYRRNGVSRVRPNQDFWDFLIPGVGAAPVKMFLAIITAFVIVIGPVNYWFLRKWKRLYLLLVTVPLGAGIVTACLLFYAVASDGFGVRTRLRSFTELDTATNTAVSWSRQSYYAGVAPSEGLVFPRTSAVFPLDAVPQKEDRRNRGIVWNEHQVLASGFITSRSMSQYMVVNAAPSEIRISVDDAKGVQVTNQLQVDVEQLVVCRDGTIYWGEGLGENDTVSLRDSVS